MSSCADGSGSNDHAATRGGNRGGEGGKFRVPRSLLTSRLQSFETELLTQADNLAGLAALNRELNARAETIDSPRLVVLDMDSTEIPVYGQQQGIPQVRLFRYQGAAAQAR